MIPAGTNAVPSNSHLYNLRKLVMESMTVRDMLTLVLSSTVFFTGFGGAIGFILGKFLPSYYTTIFRSGREEGFDPLAVGIGQGLTQGITAGAVVGVAMVIVLAWYRAKTFVPPGPAN